MNLIVDTTLTLNGELELPSSKSQSIRAIIMSALLCNGESTISNVLHSDDTEDAINACRQLGAKIKVINDTLIINSTGIPLQPLTTKINSGNSGLTTHFILPILGLRVNSDVPIILDCQDQMRARPIMPLLDALSRLGLVINFLNNKNTLPAMITGKLVGGSTYIDGITSQYLSSLLFALPCASENSVIIVENLQERQYLQMTLSWLKRQNIDFLHQARGNVDIYTIYGNQTYHNLNTTIPCDYSSAAYLIVASVLMPGTVILKKLDNDDTQADKKIITILKEMGADIQVNKTDIHIQGGKKLKGISIDGRDIPDLLPALAVIGTYASGETEIRKVGHARLKETDRIQSMVEGLAHLGAKVIGKDDGLIVHQSSLHGGIIQGYGDHRTVMALSIAGMIAGGRTTISDCESINKTFPGFINAIKSLGGKLEVENATH